LAALASSRGFTCPVSRAGGMPRSRGGALGLVAEGGGTDKAGASRRELLGVVLLGAMALPAVAGAQDEVAEAVEEIAPEPAVAVKRPRAGTQMQTAEMGADPLDRTEFRHPPHPRSPLTSHAS